LDGAKARPLFQSLHMDRDLIHRECQPTINSIYVQSDYICLIGSLILMEEWEVWEVQEVQEVDEGAI
jgi:hypothetical protein